MTSQKFTVRHPGWRHPDPLAQKNHIIVGIEEMRDLMKLHEISYNNLD
jgi:hypothetical protein